ncbi:MAG: hypothetical protein HZA46_02260 [Planctomycetales bacterium]|nr:hypothetical protein [Planctomycetales bacterium]
MTLLLARDGVEGPVCEQHTGPACFQRLTSSIGITMNAAGLTITLSERELELMLRALQQLWGTDGKQSQTVADEIAKLHGQLSYQSHWQSSKVEASGR